jgi:hypothetical protein
VLSNNTAESIPRSKALLVGNDRRACTLHVRGEAAAAMTSTAMLNADEVDGESESEVRVMETET